MANVILIMKMPGNIEVMRKALAEYDIFSTCVSKETELSDVLEYNQEPCAALVDISGFGTKVWSMCAKLHERKVPFIVLSTPQEMQVGSQSLAYGAMSVLQKPVTKSALLQLIRGLSSNDAEM